MRFHCHSKLTQIVACIALNCLYQSIWLNIIIAQWLKYRENLLVEKFIKQLHCLSIENDLIAIFYYRKNIMHAKTYYTKLIHLEFFLKDLTARELKELYERCVDLAEETDNRSVPLYQLWRDKPRHYWKDIFHTKKGKMIPYMKDFNGDQRSAINGNIKGLFFGCGLDRRRRQPPNFSYFGDERLLVNADVLLNVTKHLYFADFYCHYQYHYATLVVTNPGSRQDRFCMDHDLVQLDLFDNGLLYLDYHNNCEQTPVYVTLGIRVELFVTEGMNIFSLFNKGIGRLVNVQPRGRGHSRKNGIPKKEICNICNLY